MKQALIMYASSVFRPPMAGDVKGEAVVIREVGQYTVAEGGPVNADGTLAAVSQSFQCLTSHVLSIEVGDCDEDVEADGADLP
jgi:hypothetical protein